MSNVVGVLLFIVFILAVVGAAAGVTWIVVKLSPPKSQPPKTESS